jgi:large subunit ribosomal protein L23
MISLYSIIKRPIITEKTSSLLNKSKVSFEVFKHATKYQIHLALKKIFNINAKSINTMIIRGKLKNIGKYHGKRKNIKKAVVTINKNIDINNLIFNNKL